MKIYINKIAVYRPGDENLSESPKLEYVDALFKRRLSQISKMTIEVVHNVLDGNENAKLVFASFRGEISRQLKINKSLVEDSEVLPAQFSISVFNTPPAVATIALGMKNGYTAVYPSERKFSAALMSAVAPVLCRKEAKIIFAFADEKIPDEYAKNAESAKNEKPLAFACVIGTEKTDGAKELDRFDFSSPSEFIEGFCAK